MQKLNIAFIRTLFTLLVGGLMVVFPQEASSWFVWGVGGLILMSGIAAMVAHWIRPKEEVKNYSLILIGVVAVIGGVSILLNREANAIYLFYVLGGLPVLGALLQIFSLSRLHRFRQPMPSISYAFPLLLIAFCVLLIYRPELFAQLQIFLLGIVWILYSFFELILLFLLTKAVAKRKAALAAEELLNSGETLQIEREEGNGRCSSQNEGE